MVQVCFCDNIGLQIYLSLYPGLQYPCRTAEFVSWFFTRMVLKAHVCFLNITVSNYNLFKVNFQLLGA